MQNTLWCLEERRCRWVGKNVNHPSSGWDPRRIHPAQRRCWFPAWWASQMYLKTHLWCMWCPEGAMLVSAGRVEPEFKMCLVVVASHWHPGASAPTQHLPSWECSIFIHMSGTPYDSWSAKPDLQLSGERGKQIQFSLTVSCLFCYFPLRAFLSRGTSVVSRLTKHLV